MAGRGIATIEATEAGASVKASGVATGLQVEQA